MEERKLVPKRRFREFENKWKLQCFKEIADYRHGKAHERNVVVNGNYVIVNSKFISTNGKTEKFSNLQIEPLHEDEITFVLSDIPNGKALAKTYLISKNNRFTLNQRILGITPKRIMDSYFLKEYMNRHSYFLKFDDGANQTNLSNQDLENFKLRCPNNKEQQKIGEFFKILDERIANQERKIAKVKALKAAYLTEMFPQEGETVPKRRFRGFEGEWNETILDSVLAYEQPTDYIVDEDSYDDSYDIPVLTAGQSFLLGYTNEKHGIKKADVNNSVIIFDDFTTSSHHVDFFFKVKSSALKILSSNSRKYSTYFAYLILKNIDYTPESHERHWISIFSNFEVMTPSMEEQQKIGEFFKNLDNQIRLEEKKLDKLQKMKKAYLEEMFV